MTVVTVAGSLGGRTRDVGRAVAERLGFDYVDQEILLEAAAAMGVPVAAIENRDERPSSIGERIAGVLRTLMERSAIAGTADPMSGGGLETVLGRSYGEAAELPEAGAGQLDDERYLKTLKAVIGGVAQRGNVVILGRGSQAILHDAPETLHAYVYEPREDRVAALMAREDIKQHDAEQRIAKRDADRQAFYRRYFKVDVGDPKLYDVVVNIGRMPVPLAVQIIAEAAEQKMPRPG